MLLLFHESDLSIENALSCFTICGWTRQKLIWVNIEVFLLGGKREYSKPPSREHALCVTNTKTPQKFPKQSQTKCIIEAKSD